MRSKSLKIYVIDSLPQDLKNFLDTVGIDYEWSSAEQCWIIYYHFDDVYPYDMGLLNFMQYITGVENNFPNRKGIYKDIVELYYEVERVDEDIDWIETLDGKLYQNTRFVQLSTLYGNVEFKTRMKITGENQ